MTHLRLMLEYFHPWPNAAGFHVASHEGWYRDAGLDVEITVFDPLRGDTLEHLLRGDADFGVFPTNRLLVRRAAGQPLSAVASINHRGMETIQAVRGNGVDRPRDLAGRRIALNPTPRGVAMVRHLVAADGGDPDAVVLVDSGHRELSVDDIAAGDVDATFGGYWAWDALFARLPVEERIMWPVDEIGAPPYHSYLLGIGPALRDRPEVVSAFLAATARGYQAARTRPEDTLAVLNRVIPYFPAPVLARSLELIAPTWVHDGRWGEIREELMQPYAEWLSRYGILPEGGPWRDAVEKSAW
ncbi:ABC transporter substrate-binding protein [Paractinoplanes lichenicola]|uniref:Thiamine pyrimidine synthase n=1 Tax=Paractinoplanes lichenicola TaxID=2802976 RepID=A0ABS1VEN6_9ACTN|nr:ABC transporter substrate-binding protein [Actinoplanes lichenicola]MBL7253147.1 ABC transporter substrate-binding protein [Actinoplanes lichenicola]